MDKIQGSVAVSMQAQYEQERNQINHLQQQIEMKHNEIEQTRSLMLVEKSAEVEARQIRGDRDPRNIAPEDALDTIIRLENTLKFQKRRNALMEKENATQSLALKDKRKVLHKTKEEMNEIITKTGWNGAMRDPEQSEDMERQIVEMAQLAQRLRNEHNAAKVIIKKKEHLIEYLNEELQKKRELQEQLNQVFNDIRVTDRDCHESDMEIAKLTKADKGVDSAMVVAQASRDTVALECLEADKRYYVDEIAALKHRKRHLDQVTLEQRVRNQRLTNRLEVIMAAVHDLRLDDPRLASASRGALVPDSHEGAADDLDRIRAVDEQIPFATYEILHRDLEQVTATVSRKDIMLLEKDLVVRSLEHKLKDQKHAIRQGHMQQSDTKNERVDEMADLNNDLAMKHQVYREKIDELMSENLKLKAKVTKKSPQPAPKKAQNMIFNKK